MNCEFCNHEFSKTYESKHTKWVHTNKIDHTSDSNKTDTFKIRKNDTCVTNDKLNRTLLVGPSFCGRIYLLLNTLPLILLDNLEQQIKMTTRSPEQYTKLLDDNIKMELQDVSVEEDSNDKSIQ